MKTIIAECPVTKLPEGKTTISLDPGIEKLEGKDWQDRYKISGTNVLEIDDTALVRVSLEEVS